MANEIAIKVKKIDTTTLDDVGTAGKKAGNEAGQGIKKGLDEGERAAKQSSKNIAGSFKDAGGEISSSIGDSLSGLSAGGLALGAGAAVGGALLAGVQQQFEQIQIGGMLAAQTGATGAAAAQLGDTAGQVFGDNFGESLDDVGAAMKAVFDNKLVDRDAAQSDIRAITETAMTAAQVVGEDVSQIARAAEQLVRTGLAGSVTEALDLITHASQEGLNAAEDLIDTTTEYSTKFRDLGLSGAEAFGLVSQAVSAGARDTDTAADALKEFSIRAQDGSASTARGFSQIGLSAADMATMIAQGGHTANQALEMTLNQLRQIENPITRDQAAVDLFGTKAEDLGDALFAMDLDTAGAAFGDFADAAKKAGDQIAATAPPLEVMWRNLGKGINNAVDWGTQSDKIDEMQGKAKEAMDNAKRGEDEHRRAVDAAANAWRDQGGAIDHVVESLDEFIGKSKTMADGVIDLSEAQIGYQKALDDAAAAAKENGRTLDINNEKGRENKGVLNDLVSATYDQIGAMEDQGATAEELAGFMGTARDQFVALAIKMGMSASAANELANQLRLIPGDYSARVNADTAQASNAIRTVHGQLVDLTHRSWIASVAVTGAGSVGGGRYFAGMAHGGVVPGHAAEGGPRGNQIVAGEHGIELIDVAPGSTVHSNGDSMRMMREAASGASEVRVLLDIAPGADTHVAALFRALLGNDILRLRVDDSGKVRA